MRINKITLLICICFSANAVAQQKITVPTSVAAQPPASQPAANNELSAVKPLSEAGKPETPSSPKANATPNAQAATPTPNPAGSAQPIGVISAAAGGFPTPMVTGVPAAKKKSPIDLLRIADGEEKRTALLSVHGISKRVSVGDSVLTYVVGDIAKDSVCLKKTSKQKGCAKTVHFDE